jgi:hypothetical protein
MKTCITAADNGISRMDRLGNAMTSMGKGIGGLATGVGVGYAVYHDIYGKPLRKFELDPSSSPYHLI